MSITILGQPTNGSPLNTVDSATTYYQLDSTNSGLTNFKYINKINIIAPTTASYTYKVPPRPTTGYGLFSASDILKTYTSYSKNPYITTFTHTQPCYVRFNANFYEEYNPNLTFVDTVYLSGFMGLTFSTPHGLGVGDVITIDKDNKQVNASYDGTASITQVVNTVCVKTNKPWGVNTTGESGLITDVIKYSIPATASTIFAFNGTRQYTEVNDTFSNYLLSSTQSDWLNWQPTYWRKVRSDDYGTLGFQINSISTSNWAKIQTYDNNGSLINTFSFSCAVSSSTQKSWDIPAYPANLSSLFPTFLNNNTYYELTIMSGSNAISKVYPFEVYNECSPWQNYRIMFLNSLGKMEFWNFNWLSRKTFTIDRTEFKKTLNYQYTIGDRGQTILAQAVQESLYLSSGWISEEESEFLKELTYSPEVYWLDGTDLIPLVITDTGYEVKTALKDRLFCMTLNVKTAYRQATQNQ